MQNNLGLKVTFTGDSSSVETASKRGAASVDNYHKKVKSVGTASRKTATDTNFLGKSLTNTKKQFLGVHGAAGLLAGVLAGGLGLRKGVGIIATYSQEMSTLKGVTGANAEAFKLLEAETKRLGSTTRFTATQAAEGAVFLARAGFNTDQVLTSLSDTMLLAQAGALDLGRAADIASNVLKGFRLEADQTARVVDVLTLAANSSNTNVEQLGSAMSFAAPIAASLGVKVETTAAAIGVLSDAGIQAERAGTGLRQIFIELEKVGGDLSISTHGLASVMQTLKDRNIDLGDATDLVKKRQAASLLVMVQSADRLQEFDGQLNSATGSAYAMAKIMDDNLNGALLSVASATEGAVIALGDLGATEGLKAGLNELADAIRWATDNLEIVTDVATVLASVLVARMVPALAASSSAMLAQATASIRLSLALSSFVGTSRAAAVGIGLLGSASATAGAAMALLGGPVGVVLIAATALAVFSTNSETAAEKSEKLTNKIQGLANEFKNLGNAQRLQGLIEVNNHIGELTKTLTELEAAQNKAKFDFTSPETGFVRAESEGELVKRAAEIEGVRKQIALANATLSEMRTIDFAAADAAEQAAIAKRAQAEGIDLQKDSIDKLTAAAASAGTAMVKLDESQQDLLDSLQPLRVQNAEYQAQLAQLKEIIKSQNIGSKESAKLLKNLKLEYKDLFPALASSSKESAKFEASLNRLRGELDPVAKATAEYKKDLEILDKFLAKSGDNQDEYNKLLDVLKKRLDAAKNPMKKHGDSNKSIYDTVFPLRKAQKEYNEQLIIYIEALKAGAATPEEFRAAMERLRGEFSDLFPEIEKQATAADELATAWEQAMIRIDETFADAWTGAFDSFDDFKDKILGSFKSLIGEMAHFAITRPILVSLGLSNAGTQGGGGSFAERAASLVGGGQQSNGGQSGAGFNLGDLFTQGGSINSVLTSGISGILATTNGAIYNGAANLFQGLNAAGYGGVSSYLGQGLANQSALGTNIGNSVGIQGGGATVGFLATAAAGYAGGYAGNALGESLSDKRANSNYGQAAGGVAGAVIGAKIGTVAGPIGAAIGAAIGALVDVFAGSEGHNRVAVGVGTGNSPNFRDVISDETGASGLRLRSINNRGEQQGYDAAEQLLQTMLTIDNSLTALSSANGIDVDFSNKIFGDSTGQSGHPELEKLFFGVFGSGNADEGDLVGAADSFAVQWIAEINNQLPQRIRQGLSGIDQTAEAIINSFEALSTIDTLLGLDVVDNIEDAIAELQEAPATLLESYARLTEDVLQFTSELDGTHESVIALSNGLAEQKNVALQLALAYKEVGASINGIFDSAINRIEESVLNQEELYARRRDQVSELFTQLAETIDPEQISSIVSQIDATAASAFDLLDDSQKADLGQEFIDFLNNARATALEQVAEGEDSLRSREAGIESGIDFELANGAAQRQAEAAGAQVSAAELQAQAAAGQLAASERIAESIGNLGGIAAILERLQNQGNTGGFDFSSIGNIEVNA